MTDLYVKHNEQKIMNNVRMNLQERIIHLLETSGKSQSDLARFLGISRATVSDWKSGKIKSLSSENAFKAGQFFNVNPEWLATGKGPLESNVIEGQVIRQALPGPIVSNATWGPEFDVWDSSTPLRDDEVALPFFREVRLSAGAGISEVQENHGCKLRFSSATLRRQSVDSNNAACVNVSGTSMEPVLPNGTTVGIDTSQKDIVDGKMYAIDHGGHLRVKLLYRLPSGGIRLRSYNQDEYPDELYKMDELGELRILGKVFWYSVLL